VLGSIPTVPTNHLLDGLGLNENTRGQKGADKADGPVFVRAFSAVRVTTGFIRSGIQHSFPKTPCMTSSQMSCYRARNAIIASRSGWPGTSCQIRLQF
jgi:hypothetical protein